MQWTQTLESIGVSTESRGPVAGRAQAERWPQSPAEFEALIENVQDELVHFAFCRLRSIPDAEDVVQEILVEAYIGREKHRAVAMVRPYLYRMVANRCTDLLRKRKRTETIDEAAAAAIPAAQDNDQSEAVRRLRQIEQALSHLPEQQAEVMRLRIFTGLPFASIAAAVGASEPTIKSRFRYAVDKLRSILIPKEAKR